MTDRDDRRLRAFFRDLHEELEPPVPPYSSVARPDRDASGARDESGARDTAPIGVGAALVRALGLALAAGALVLVIRGGAGRVPAGDQAMRLALALGDWEAPTDFLLQTPGTEFFQSPPAFAEGLEEMTGDRTDFAQEEVSR